MQQIAEGWELRRFKHSRCRHQIQQRERGRLQTHAHPHTHTYTHTRHLRTPVNADALQMVTMWPWFRSTMSGRNAFTNQKWDRVFTWNVLVMAAWLGAGGAGRGQPPLGGTPTPPGGSLKRGDARSTGCPTIA